MITKKFKTNLNCSNCVDAVTPYLNGDRAIHSWRVDTTSPDKVLTVEGDNLTKEIVAPLVAKAGFQILGEIEQPAAEHANHDTAVATGEPPTSYYPLLLVLFFILGVTALVELRNGAFSWERAMNSFMAGFFLVFSFFKLLDVRAFADSYSMYDIVAKRWPMYGLIYPFIELTLGAAYLVHFQPLVTNIVTVIVMSVSAVGVIESLINKRKIRCACLGAVFNLPMSTVTLLEDLLMVGMAVAMLIILL